MCLKHVWSRMKKYDIGWHVDSIFENICQQKNDIANPGYLKNNVETHQSRWTYFHIKNK